MAGSVSQTTNLVPRGRSATGTVAPPRAGLRQRSGTVGRSGASSGKLSQNVMNFYTDDSPGLKISPVIVITMSIGFIIFVTFLHIVGKVRGV